MIEEQIRGLRETLRKITGNDPISRSRRAAIQRQIFELTKQL